MNGQPSPAAPTVEPTAEPASTEAPEIKGFVNPDGTFLDGWYTRLSNEALHKEETLPRFKNVEDLAQSYVHIRKQVPMDKVAVPSETSTPEIWDAWHKANGRPDTADEYAIERPENLPEDYWSEELVTEAKNLFHKLGLNHNQVKAIMELDNQRVIVGINAQADIEAREKSEAEMALKQKWQADYQARLHLANRMVNENTEMGEMRQKVLEKIGNDPIVADFLANVATKFLEHGVITADMEIPSSADLATLDQKIRETMAKEGFNNRTHPDHKFLVEEVKKLYKQKYELNKKLQITR